MFFARRILKTSAFLLIILYAFLIYFSYKQYIFFDYFNGALILMGIYLLLKSVCYYSDSSFFFGTILFFMGLMFYYKIFTNLWIIYPIMFCIISFITYIFFDSNLMKIVFYCSIGINFFSIFLYFLL